MKKLLNEINYPSDLRKLRFKSTPQVSKELREELIDVVSETGGHLGAGLGVIELTVALHYVFNTPKDKLIWDVSHQSYPHKIITGRKNKMRSLRKEGGISGFTKDQRVNMTLLEQHTAPPQYHQLWEFQWLKNYQTKIIIL